MSAWIRWSEDERGAALWVEAEGERVPIDQWALAAGGGGASPMSGLPVLLGLLEDERLVEIREGAVVVPHSALAELTPGELTQLGLPERAPFTLTLEGQGLLTDPGFRFSYCYLDPSGRQIMGPERSGAFLRTGSKTWILGEPLFSIVAAVDRYNAAPPEDAQERFLRWSDIRQLLPDDAVVDGYLRGMQVALASSFTLDVRASKGGGLTFDPVLVRRKTRCETIASDARESSIEPTDTDQPVNSLPPSAERSLAGTFRRFSEARGRYALGGGWYVVLDEPLRRALDVVRKMQDAPPAQRRAFSANPHAVLRERLSSDLPEEVLADLFFEPPDYGERVAEAGVWEPKVLPFLKQSTQPWLPPEIIGLLIDGQEVKIAPADVPEIRQKIEEAIREGQAEVDYKGKPIPATEAALNALQALEASSSPGNVPEKPDTSKAPHEKLVLLLQDKDNLNALAFSPGELARRLGDPLPASGLLTALKRHQVAGYEWLQRHWMEGSAGALLADDMGLGKTLVCLAFMAWMQAQNAKRERAGPVLVVAPTGLLQNWVAEHDLHLECPGLGLPLRAYGATLQGLRHSETHGLSEAQAGAPVLRTGEMELAPWVLTTYETLRDYAHSFGRVRWSAVVFDEAQKIKNPCALMTEEAKAVASNADFVIAMTGTPVENRLTDLWSIVDTCQPGVLRDLKSFLADYDRDTEREPDALLSLKTQLAENPAAPHTPPRVLLRRLKHEELDGLPTREDHVVRREMPMAQAQRYTTAVNSARQGGKTQGAMLSALQQMRIASLHPHPVGDGLSDEEYVQQSARLSQAMEVLERIRQRGEKALVFLEFRHMQFVLQGLLQRRFGLDHPPLVINGSVQGDRRKGLVDRFQAGRGFDVMILSPRAGGVGLTLTAANHVVHLSRWWNPAIEDQCTDRIYRIGQERRIHVYVPMAIHPVFKEASFDERLHALLERKRELSRQVLGLGPVDLKEGDLAQLFQQTTAG